MYNLFLEVRIVFVNFYLGCFQISVTFCCETQKILFLVNWSPNGKNFLAREGRQKIVKMTQS